MMLKICIPCGVASHELDGLWNLKILKRKKHHDGLYHNTAGLCHTCGWIADRGGLIAPHTDGILASGLIMTCL